MTEPGSIELKTNPGRLEGLTRQVVLAACALMPITIALAEPLDKFIRLVIVTPGFHAVHHSSAQPETDSNYGFNVPWWDRLFGTYRAQPDAGHEQMTIGLPQHQTSRRQTVAWMLALPFRQGSA